MNKKFLVSWTIVFVLWMVGSFVVHGVLLNDMYGQLPNLFRTETETQSLFHYMVIAHVMMAGAFVWIYRRGREDKPWLVQGLRYGLAIAVLATIPTYMIYYVVQPIPESLSIAQAVGGSVIVVILGAVVAFLNK